MHQKTCKLYDETLVHAIMVSTGLAIVDYIKQSKGVNAADVYAFVERNAGHIIHTTIDGINHEISDDPEFPIVLPDDDDALRF